MAMMGALINSGVNNNSHNNKFNSSTGKKAVDVNLKLNGGQ